MIIVGSGSSGLLRPISNIVSYCGMPEKVEVVAVVVVVGVVVVVVVEVVGAVVVGVIGVVVVIVVVVVVVVVVVGVVVGQEVMFSGTKMAWNPADREPTIKLGYSVDVHVQDSVLQPSSNTLFP